MTSLRTTSACAVGFALTALGLAAAHPAAAGITIYNFQIHGPGLGGNGVGSNTLFNGAGALGGGTTWNVVDNSPVTNALTSTGGASTVGFSAGRSGTYTGYNDGVSTHPDQLLSNFAFASGSSIQDLHFSNLPANTAFTVDLYGINGGFNDRGTKFNLTGSNYSTIIATATTLNANSTTFVLGDNYVQFTGVTDATGNVYATYQTSGRYGTNLTGSAEGDFNGAQISISSAAPEPPQVAGLAFTALGIGGLILRARKRTATAAQA